MKKLAKEQFFVNNFFVERFFLNFAFRFGISVKFCIFRYPYWPTWRKKFSTLFLKGIRQSILLYSMILSRWGRRSTYMRRDAREERGGAIFLLKCHALCPICLTFLVVHFYTLIYVSILNLCFFHFLREYNLARIGRKK